MGIIKKAVQSVAKDVAEGAGIAAVVGAVEVAGVAVEAVGAAGGFVANKLGKVIDKRNLASLKKEAKKHDYCLFVSKEAKLGEGIYKIINKKKEEKYNTLLDGNIDKNFKLHLYTKLKGEVATLHKNVTVTKSFFSADKYSTQYSISSSLYPSGSIKEKSEGKQKQYITSFNNWVITGEFSKGNYKIFDKDTGKTVATISKKFKSASTYTVDCEYDKNEPIIVLITILIDIIE